MLELKIDIELDNLLPKLDEEKYKLLEEEIRKNGCINPIIIWNGYIVDGHHRYRICKANNIEFKTKEMEFENKQEAMIWAWTTQKARRNIDDGALFKIARTFKPYYEKKAKENQGTRTDLFQKSEKGCEKEETFISNDTNVNNTNIKKIDTIQELADMTGTGRNTMNKVIQVQKHAPAPVQKAVENNVISINKGYEITKKLKEVPKENKQKEAEKLIEEHFSQECKELDKSHKIYCRINDAVYKPISIEITKENVGYWVENMSQEELEEEERNIEQAINNLKEIRRIMQSYKNIRRVK